MKNWASNLLIAVAVLGAAILFYAFVYLYCLWSYGRLKKTLASDIDIDDFCGRRGPYAANPIKVVAGTRFQVGFRTPSPDAVPLEVEPSASGMQGLWMARKAGTSTSKQAQPMDKFIKSLEQKPIVIGTIRMGFGHHRLAYSVASWAIAQGRQAIFHDLVEIESEEADLISDTDKIYSKMSRLATEVGGPVATLWGIMTKSGDHDALRSAAFMAVHLQPLFQAYPRDIPIVSSHQLPGLAAASLGFTNIVNLVVDNCAQWFLVVPKTINVVQGPKNFHSFLKMGVQQKELSLVGHFCPQELVDNIDEDCERRLQRHTSGKPLRLLIPVGGAGAQKTYITDLLYNVAPLVKNGKLELFLNAGDHDHMKTAFRKTLKDCGLGDYSTVDSTKGTYDFQKSLLDNKSSPKSRVTLFAYDEYFPAVASTDILSRVADVLVVKPSELAFYCIPRLHIHRVGDHEADAAVRAAEIGDGTLECEQVKDAMRYIELMLANDNDLFESMNKTIQRNNSVGMYNGTKNAVDMVLQSEN